METAEFIRPDCGRVTVVEMTDTICSDMPEIPRILMMERAEGSIEMLTGCRVKGAVRRECYRGAKWHRACPARL